MGSTADIQDPSYARSHQTRLAAVEIGKDLFSVTPENLKKTFFENFENGSFQNFRIISKFGCCLCSDGL
jgi:hypothetical protein